MAGRTGDRAAHSNRVTPFSYLDGCRVLQVGGCDGKKREMLLTLGGRRVEDPVDVIRRFCGLDWSGGPGETWAYAYYDATIASCGILELGDVTATAALHPGLSRADLAFFRGHLLALRTWLAVLPVGVGLARVDDYVLDHLLGLADLTNEVTLSLLSKVLHRARPELIPLVDRHVLDRYRSITGKRATGAAWPDLVRAMRADLQLPANRLALDEIRQELQAALATCVPSDVRLVDIAIWMEAR
jgi:hypothetical protein